MDRKTARAGPSTLAASSLADSADFDLVGLALGRDLKKAVRVALGSGAVFPNGKNPLSIFRATLRESIRDIESHRRGRLLREFLSKGPYVDSGPIPRRVRGEYLSDDDVARVIAFIYSFMVNSFKGAVAELLAVGASTRLVRRLKGAGQIPAGTQVFVGDSVLVRGKKSAGWRKGADLHLLVEETGHGDRGLRLAGVAEVKSSFRSDRRLHEHIDQHVRRARRGLRVGRNEWPSRKVRMGCGPTGHVIRIIIEPDDWLLPRSFQFRKHRNGRSLHVMPGVPPCKRDEIRQNPCTGDWRITLKWSKESLAEAAYEMTFWYMEKVGEALYSSPKKKPKEWGEMTPGEAGRNAAKMMLYYAILRCRTVRENQRAIALYNTYGFGYALGMNFRNKTGSREMLWPQDLEDIAANGCTKAGCRIV